jgi:hypothetical protein
MVTRTIGRNNTTTGFRLDANDGGILKDEFLIALGEAIKDHNIPGIDY